MMNNHERFDVSVEFDHTSQYYFKQYYVQRKNNLDLCNTTSAILRHSACPCHRILFNVQNAFDLSIRQQ